MNPIIIHFAVSTVLGAIKMWLKSPAGSELVKELLIEIRDDITRLYPDVPVSLPLANAKPGPVPVAIGGESA